MRKISKVLSLLLVFAMIVPGLAQAAPANGEEVVTRLAGAGRWETAAEISKEAFEDGSEYVVIASGRDFGDALAGSSLAAAYDAPILLTKEDVLPEAAEKEIKRLDAEKAIILGGTAVVGEEVEEALVDLGLEVEYRLGGANRYDTAALIAEKVLAKTNAKTAVVVSGSAYADGMAVGAYAGLKGYPVLYVREGSVAPETAKALKAVNNVLLVGGTAVINKSVENTLKEDYFVEALRGDHRVTTALAIAEKFDKPAKAIVANGYDFADALVASVLGAKNNAPVLLVKNNEIREEVVTFLEESGIKEAYVVGGVNSVNATVATEVKETIETPVVESVSAIEQTIQENEEVELKFLVNGKDKVTAEEFKVKYGKQGYTVAYKYDNTSIKVDDKEGTVKATADFKYAVQVEDSEGKLIPEELKSTDFVKVTVKDTKVAKVTEVKLSNDLAYVPMNIDNVTFIATKAVNGLGKELNEKDIAAGKDSLVEVKNAVSSNVGVAYFEDGKIVPVSTGRATFTVDFVDVKDSVKITVEIKAKQVATSIKKIDNIKVAKDSYQLPTIDVLDQYGEVMSMEENDVEVKYFDKDNKEVANFENADEGVYTAKVVVKSDEKQIGTFKVELVDVTGKYTDSYKLSFKQDGDKKEINELDLNSSNTLKIDVTGYYKGTEMSKVELPVGTTLGVKTSNEKLATAELDNEDKKITVEKGSEVKVGEVKVTIFEKKGDMITDKATVTVKIVNSAPQITELKFQDSKAKALTVDNGTNVIDVFEKDDVLEQLTAGKDKNDGEILTEDMIKEVKFINRVANEEQKEVKGKVVITINDLYGGKVFTFDGVVKTN